MSIPRSTFYSKSSKNESYEEKLKELVYNIFIKSNGAFGKNRIRDELRLQHGIHISNHRVKDLMNELDIHSSYQKRRFRKPKNNGSSNESIPNLLEREFSNREELEAIVGDLSYIKVKDNYWYLCIFVDLFNREIVSYSLGAEKTSNLVLDCLNKIPKAKLRKIKILHTDRGLEFVNSNLKDFCSKYKISQSCSRKASPHDNAVAEATFKTIKTECILKRIYQSSEELIEDINYFVDWYNNYRPHTFCNNQPPATKRKKKN